MQPRPDTASKDPDPADRWPRLLGSPGPSARIRVEPEDFEVEEIPAYLPSGSGSHLMIRLRKRDRTTDEAVRALARHLDVPRNEIGVAGLKDRRAVTTQWLSVPASAAGRLDSFQEPGLQVLESGLHGNKLRTGHLRGNRFRLVLREWHDADLATLRLRADELLRRGVPNYFGEQRFGWLGANEQEGRELLKGHGRRHDRRTLRLLLSAAQSGLFNDVLAERMRSGLFSTVLAGDVLARAESGGLFTCSDPTADQPRLDAFEVHLTGPLFGPKMRAPAGRPADREREILAGAGLDPEAFGRFSKLTQGTRRALRFTVPDLAFETEPDALVLRFSLPAGSYATTLLRELVDYRD